MANSVSLPLQRWTSADPTDADGVIRLREGLPHLVRDTPDAAAFMARFRQLAQDILAAAESPTHRAALLIEITRMGLEAGVPARFVRQALFDDRAPREDA